MIRTKYKRSVIWIALSACFWLGASNVQAIGLGRIVVNSSLNQPLDAEISIASIDENALTSLEIRLATDSDFRRANISIEPIVKLLQFNVINGETGPWIHVTTNSPIRSPFLHFLAAIEWSGGKIVREYTAFLDPPGYGTVAGQSVVLASSADQRAIQPGDTYEPVKSGETLMGIATRIEVEQNVTVYQRMFALMHANSEAFIRGNMNLLREGTRLIVPSVEMMAGISRILAREEYTRQLSDWMGYRQGIEQGRAESGQRLWVSLTPSQKNVVVKEVEKTIIKEVSTDTAKSSQDATKNNDGTSTNTATRGEYVLRIVQPIPDIQPEIVGKDSNSVVDPTNQSAIEFELEKTRNRLILVEETLASKGLENEQLLRQIALLAEQIDKSAKIIALQDEALSLAEQQAILRAQKVVTINSDMGSNESDTEVAVELSGDTVQVSVLAESQDASTSKDSTDLFKGAGQISNDRNLSTATNQSDAEPIVEVSIENKQASVLSESQDASTSKDSTDQVKEARQTSNDRNLSTATNQSDAEPTVESSNDKVQTSVLVKSQDASASKDSNDQAEVPEQELHLSKSKQLLIIVGVAAIVALLIIFLIRRGRQQVFQSVGGLTSGDEGDTMAATTQLDLARAYIEMGDHSAARNALDEVLLRGDEDQKASAQDMLRELQTKNREYFY